MGAVVAYFVGLVAMAFLPAKAPDEGACEAPPPDERRDTGWT